MRTHHARELAFDGPVTLQLWPQPAVAVPRVRLSERGRPRRSLPASITRRCRCACGRCCEREIEVESVSARGVTLHFQRDADGQRNIDDLLDRVASGEPRAGKPLTLDSLELADVALKIDDAHAGVHGRLADRRVSTSAPSAPARCRHCICRRRPT